MGAVSVRVVTPERGVYTCRVNDALQPEPGHRYLAKLDYGLDVATVVAILKTADASLKSHLVRAVTPEDETKIRNNAEEAKRAATRFDALMAKELPGHVYAVHVRFSFDREVLFIRYGSKTPANVRRSLPTLSREFRAYVDIWQWNGRERAAALGVIGVCGRRACCCRGLRDFPEVNVKMARDQGVFLNPTTANGVCGKMKCCFAYEVPTGSEASHAQD